MIEKDIVNEILGVMQDVYVNFIVCSSDCNQTIAKKICIKEVNKTKEILIFPLYSLKK